MKIEMMCRQCVLKESLQSNEICGTFGVEPVCNLYKIASGLCFFFLHYVFVGIFVESIALSAIKYLC